jgi:hypothetical protein
MLQVAKTEVRLDSGKSAQFSRSVPSNDSLAARYWPPAQFTIAQAG